MKKIIDYIYVGTVDEVKFAEQFNYSILGCCKEPLHRKHARLSGATEEGYVGKAMPRDEKEYLYAERDHALYLNLIDARDMKYIPDECINKALDFIDKEIEQDRNILIVCNKAESRSPSIALMWLMYNNRFDRFYNVETIISIFCNSFYEKYNPSNGMRDYVIKFWEECKNGKQYKTP